MVKVASWRDSRKTVKVPDPPEKLPPPYRLCAMEIDDVSPAASLRPSLKPSSTRASAPHGRHETDATRLATLNSPHRVRHGAARHALPCATSSLSSSCRPARTRDSVNFSQYTNPVRDESLIHALYTDLTHSLSQPKPSLVVYLTKPSRVCCPPSPHRSADPPL